MRKGDFFVSDGRSPDARAFHPRNRSGKLRAIAQSRLYIAAAVCRSRLGRRRKDSPQDDSLETTREFGNQNVEFDVDAPDWRWARLAIWDIAGNGAFANPVRNDKRRRPWPWIIGTTASRNLTMLGKAHTRAVSQDWPDATRFGRGYAYFLGAFDRPIAQGHDVLIVVDPDTPQESKYAQLHHRCRDRFSRFVGSIRRKTVSVGE